MHISEAVRLDETAGQQLDSQEKEQRTFSLRRCQVAAIEFLLTVNEARKPKANEQCNQPEVAGVQADP